MSRNDREGVSSLYIAAIVLAGGSGKRMRSDVPKQYLKIGDYPVIYYSLKAFQESAVQSIVLVCQEGEVSYCREQIVEKYGFDKVKFITEGGAERYDSVYRGLQCVSDSDYVLIHDGARPFVTREIIAANIEAVQTKKACVTGVPSKDTIKMADAEGKVLRTLPRETMWITQTPQTFETATICEAYEKLWQQETISVTDDAMIVETVLQRPVYFVTGDYRNIKITTPEDLLVAQVFSPGVFR